MVWGQLDLARLITLGWALAEVGANAVSFCVLADMGVTPAQVVECRTALIHAHNRACVEHLMP